MADLPAGYGQGHCAAGVACTDYACVKAGHPGVRAGLATAAEPDLSELAPLLAKIATEMGKEPGALMLRPEFLGALAARASLAAAAFVGNPLAGYHCNSCDGHSCPDVG